MKQTVLKCTSCGATSPYEEGTEPASVCPICGGAVIVEYMASIQLPGSRADVAMLWSKILIEMIGKTGKSLSLIESALQERDDEIRKTGYVSPEDEKTIFDAFPSVFPSTQNILSEINKALTAPFKWLVDVLPTMYSLIRDNVMSNIDAVANDDAVPGNYDELLSFFLLCVPEERRTGLMRILFSGENRFRNRGALKTVDHLHHAIGHASRAVSGSGKPSSRSLDAVSGEADLDHALARCVLAIASLLDLHESPDLPAETSEAMERRVEELRPKQEE